VGKTERYIKDDHELNQFLLKMALDEAIVVPKAGAEAISGAALEAMAREYLLAEAVINRLDHLVNPEVLHTIVDANLKLDLSNEAAAQASASELSKRVNHGIQIRARYDEAHERWQLRVEKMHHGNLKVGVIDEDLLISGDWAQLMKTADMLSGLFGAGGYAQRGEKKSPVVGFAQAMNWLLAEVERTVSKQRYKGLGEMNPGQLWETTMDPKVRRLLKVQIEDAIGADEIFTTLMGELVEPRRNFIESNALAARNIDV